MANNSITSSDLREQDELYVLFYTKKENKYAPIPTDVPARNEEIQKQQHIVDDNELNGKSLYHLRRVCFIMDGQPKSIHKNPEIGRKSPTKKLCLKSMKKEASYPMGGRVFHLYELQRKIRNKKKEYDGQR